MTYASCADGSGIPMQPLRPQQSRKQLKGPPQRQRRTEPQLLRRRYGSMACAAPQRSRSAWQPLCSYPEPCTSKRTRCRLERCATVDDCQALLAWCFIADIICVQQVHDWIVHCLLL